MDILVRKYVEKKANKWGFSDDIDISKEIIKVENTFFTIAGIHYIFTRPDISFTKNIVYLKSRY